MPKKLSKIPKTRIIRSKPNRPILRYPPHPIQGLWDFLLLLLALFSEITKITKLETIISYSSRVTSAVCIIFTGFAAQSIRRSYPCITLSEQHPAPSGRNAVSPIAEQTYEAPYTRSIDQGASTKNLYTSWAVAIAGS